MAEMKFYCPVCGKHIAERNETNQEACSLLASGYNPAEVFENIFQRTE